MKLQEDSDLFSGDIIKYLSSVNETNSLLAGVLASVIEHGRFFAFGNSICDELTKHTSFNFKSETVLTSQNAANWSTNDFYFVQSESIDELLQLGQITSAQIILVSDSEQMPDYLYDYHLKHKEFGFFCSSLREGIREVQRILPALKHSLVSRPALFLDRDGVVVKHVDHLANPNQVELMPGVADLIKAARAANHLIFIVTNQSGIGRKYFSHDDYVRVNRKMTELLAAEGSYLDKIYFSPFFQGSTEVYGFIKKSLRKPRPGMLIAASKTFNIDLKNSALVGDRATDLIAGALAGIKAAFLINQQNQIAELEQFEKWERSLRKKIQTKIKAVNSFDQITF